VPLVASSSVEELTTSKNKEVSVSYTVLYNDDGNRGIVYRVSSFVDYQIGYVFAIVYQCEDNRLEAFFSSTSPSLIDDKETTYLISPNVCLGSEIKSMRGGLYVEKYKIYI
jgi:hypothetical protein